MSNTKRVRIDYTIRDGVDLATVKTRIGEFVAGIRGHHASHQYTSFQHQAAPRQFTHVGVFEEERVKDLQAQPFFGAFTAFLREHSEQGPAVTALDEVASTR